ncbi:MAG: hypothetical protein ACAF41_12980 [Leptolyngbya sp. BL-A-14]
MVTQFITLTIELQRSPADLLRMIEAQLQTYGDPLRWAVTDVDLTAQTAIVEAIVTRKNES